MRSPINQFGSNGTGSRDSALYVCLCVCFCSVTADVYMFVIHFCEFVLVRKGMCVFVVCTSLVLLVSNADFTLVPTHTCTHAWTCARTHISLTSVSVCVQSCGSGLVWLIPQPSMWLSACLPQSTAGFDMEMQSEEPGKPLKRDGGNKRAKRTAESIKAKRGKILNLCLLFITTGLRGKEREYQVSPKFSDSVALRSIKGAKIQLLKLLSTASNDHIHPFDQLRINSSPLIMFCSFSFWLYYILCFLSFSQSKHNWHKTAG